MNSLTLYVQAMKLDPIEAMNYLQSETCAVSDLAVTMEDVAEADCSKAILRLRARIQDQAADARLKAVLGRNTARQCAFLKDP